MKYLGLCLFLALSWSISNAQDCPGNITQWTAEDELEFAGLDSLKKLEYLENMLSSDDKILAEDVAFLNLKKNTGFIP